VRAFIKDGRLQNITFPPEPSRQDFMADPFWTLRDWLDRALETAALELDDRWILVTLDEAEKLGEAIEAGDLTPRIFDQLRDFIQHRDRLAFLFSGVQPLDELGPNWSNSFISTVPIEIGYLEPEEAEDLLRKPIDDFNFTYADGIVEEILRLTRCQPYLVQLMGWTLVNTANEQQVKRGDRQLLTDALPEALTNGTPYFDNLWQDLVAPKTHPKAKPLAQEFLFQLADHQLDNAPYPDATDPALQPALTHMLRYKVIEQLDNGTYQIQVPLVALWVRDRAE
ncbi:MAG: ATP-binding protein, partial [Cyanophyceae cyanobacterium]